MIAEILENGIFASFKYNSLKSLTLYMKLGVLLLPLQMDFLHMDLMSGVFD